MRFIWGRLFVLGLVPLVLAPALPALTAGNLKATLARLDAAAAHFHTMTADFEFDTIQTEPVPDKDVQKGVVYYQREGSNFQMGVHIDDVNGQKAPKVIVCCQGGAVRLYEEKLNQVTTLSRLSQYQSWFMLGFGASGKDLADKWSIADEGQETVNGVNAEKLAMIPKDPAVRRNIPKVTLWMDLNRGVSVKQVFDEGVGQTRVATYRDFRMNQPLPRNAFTFETNKQTTQVNR